MNYTAEITEIVHPLVAKKPSFLSKFSEIIKACERTENLIIVIYLIEAGVFLYGNTAFKKMAGRRYAQLLENGWEFWFKHIVPEEYRPIKKSISRFLSRPFYQDHISLKYHVLNCSEEKVYVKHEIALNRFDSLTLAINYFYDLSGREQIERCLRAEQNESPVLGTIEKVNSISPREEQVLKLIADGYSSKQIADQLFISNHTAISHRKHLIEKFRVKNTAQLIKKASQIMDL